MRHAAAEFADPALAAAPRRPSGRRWSGSVASVSGRYRRTGPRSTDTGAGATCGRQRGSRGCRCQKPSSRYAHGAPLGLPSGQDVRRWSDDSAVSEIVVVKDSAARAVVRDARGTVSMDAQATSALRAAEETSEIQAGLRESATGSRKQVFGVGRRLGRMRKRTAGDGGCRPFRRFRIRRSARRDVAEPASMACRHFVESVRRFPGRAAGAPDTDRRSRLWGRYDSACCMEVKVAPCRPLGSVRSGRRECRHSASSRNSSNIHCSI